MFKKTYDVELALAIFYDMGTGTFKYESLAICGLYLKSPTVTMDAMLSFPGDMWEGTRQAAFGSVIA